MIEIKPRPTAKEAEDAMLKERYADPCRRLRRDLLTAIYTGVSRGLVKVASDVPANDDALPSVADRAPVDLHVVP